MQHCDDDVLALVALGEEPSFADAAHLNACGECRAEVESLRRLVTTVRVPVPEGAAVPPPARVWEEIAAATGATVTPRTVPAPAAPSDPMAPVAPAAGAAPARPAAPSASSSGTSSGTSSSPSSARHRDDVAPLARRRRAGSGMRSLLLVAASALVVGAAGGIVGTRALTPDPQPPKPKLVTQVVLAALPVDPQAKGEARVLSTKSGRELTVDVSRLAGTSGFYEVWLIDRGVKKMIPLGILHGSQGQFAIPEGVDLSQYPIVDVSAEPLDGNPQHSGKSLLRGTIQA